MVGHDPYGSCPTHSAGCGSASRSPLPTCAQRKKNPPVLPLHTGGQRDPIDHPHTSHKSPGHRILPRVIVSCARPLIRFVHQHQIHQQSVRYSSPDPVSTAPFPAALASQRRAGKSPPLRPRISSPFPGLGSRARARLPTYGWPGGVRVRAKLCTAKPAEISYSSLEAQSPRRSRWHLAQYPFQPTMKTLLLDWPLRRDVKHLH